MLEKSNETVKVYHIQVPHLNMIHFYCLITFFKKAFYYYCCILFIHLLFLFFLVIRLTYS